MNISSQQRTSRMTFVVAVVFVATSVGSACTTSLTTMQTARPLAPGEIRVTGGASLPVATAGVEKLLELEERVTDELKQANTSGEMVTEEMAQDAIDGALALVLFTPMPIAEAQLRVGVIEGVDAGLRYTGQLVKADAKYMVHEDGPHVFSVGAGYAYHLEPPMSQLGGLFELFDFVDLSAFERHDLDLAALYGWESGRWFRVYTGPRYVGSWISVEAVFDSVELDPAIVDTDVEGAIHHVGAVGGFFVGYEWIFINLELSVYHLSYTTKIFGEERDLSGWLIAPAGALAIEF